MRRRRPPVTHVAAVIGGTVLAAIAAVTAVGHGSPVSGSRPVHHCVRQDAGQYPDPACTPGATDPRVTQATIRRTICVPGYTATVRRTTQALKDAVLGSYGLQRPFAGELDHWISLELGGADSAANLWPESGSIPNPKDAVENRLHRDVCAGSITLAQAQFEITHWTAYR